MHFVGCPIRIVPLFVLSFVPVWAGYGQDAALAAPEVNAAPGETYGDDTRAFQGIPGLERASNGRLWATWYGGGETEGPENYVMLTTSGDDGVTWSPMTLVLDPPGDVRAFDPALWHDPTGRLWLFWAQGYSHWDGRAGVWAITTDDSGSADGEWSAPRRICDGIMMNKPTALSTGAWLLPVAIWSLIPNPLKPEYGHDVTETTGSYVYASTDEGATWTARGRSVLDERQCDEHMVVERKDGSLWMLVRTSYGVAESVSRDGGVTWEDKGRAATVTHIPHARFFIRRLQSGRLLLVRHNPPKMDTRSHLTAFLSNDDGMTWGGGLQLDERGGVSYPDGVQAEDGTIYVIYDFERKRARQILMAVFTEADVKEGAFASNAARERVVVNQASD